MFSDLPLTKRQLGWLLVAGGSLFAILSLGVHLAGTGRYEGIGPALRMALAGATLIIVFGLSLVPLGHRPA